MAGVGEELAEAVSEARCSANERSIVPSMTFNEAPSLPTSLVSSSRRTRRVRSPAAIATRCLLDLDKGSEADTDNRIAEAAEPDEEKDSCDEVDPDQSVKRSIQRVARNRYDDSERTRDSL